MMPFAKRDEIELEGLDTFESEGQENVQPPADSENPLSAFDTEEFAPPEPSLLSEHPASWPEIIRSCNQQSVPARRLNAAWRSNYVAVAAAFGALVTGGAALGVFSKEPSPVSNTLVVHTVAAPAVIEEQPQPSPPATQTAEVESPAAAVEAAPPSPVEPTTGIREPAVRPSSTLNTLIASVPSTTDRAPLVNSPGRIPGAEVKPLPVPPPLAKVSDLPLERVAGNRVSSEAVAIPAPASAPGSNDEDAVRKLLSRFQSAYDRLDAGAAKSIWPSVDERALARAFDGLQAQDLSFDECRLSLTGIYAQAYCTGVARYVRRVGSRASQQEPRRWTFKFSKDEIAWRIDSVDTR